MITSENNSGVPTTITIDNVDAGTLVQGNYKLYVKGESDAQLVLFEQDTPINYDAKAMSIFIQTDKAIYKPGSAGWWKFFCFVFLFPKMSNYLLRIV